MNQDEIERGSWAELIPGTAALDRLDADNYDPQLAPLIVNARRHLGHLLDRIAERQNMARFTKRQLADFRRQPWDRP